MNNTGVVNSDQSGSGANGKSFPFTPVYLDEFSSFVYPGFEQILNKARSANVAMHICHQSVGDLEAGLAPNPVLQKRTLHTMMAGKWRRDDDMICGLEQFSR